MAKHGEIEMDASKLIHCVFFRPTSVMIERITKLQEETSNLVSKTKDLEKEASMLQKEKDAIILFQKQALPVIQIAEVVKRHALGDTRRASAITRALNEAGNLVIKEVMKENFDHGKLTRLIGRELGTCDQLSFISNHLQLIIDDINVNLIC